MVCISVIESNVVHLSFQLLHRLLVQTMKVGEQSILSLLNIAVSGSFHFFGEVRSAKDGPNFARRFYRVLVIALLSSSVMDVVPEVPITDEFLDLILEHNALLCGVADILVTPTILILISFGVASSQ